MKNIFLISFILFVFGSLNAQTSIDLSGKIFQNEKNTINSSCELKFKSNTQVVYIITNVINGKTYIDECNGKSIVNGNKISIVCTCADKEMYTEPIEDSFTYESKSKFLTSGKRSIDGKNIIWKLK
jgi:hypothetical protein